MHFLLMQGSDLVFANAQERYLVTEAIQIHIAFLVICLLKLENLLQAKLDVLTLISTVRSQNWMMQNGKKSYRFP